LKIVNRREFVLGLAALLGGPIWARASALGTAWDVKLAASWQAGNGYQVGVLTHDVSALKVNAALPVPTRAHGLLREPGGTLLAVARRPGDWLLRWDRQGRALLWFWIEPRRAFTGHILTDSQRIYTGETDLDSGAGLIGVRDAHTLEKAAEWPTRGIDPHQLVWDAGGNILVANGGVSTRPKSGRVKVELATMDSSLVRLDAVTGERLGQWRLDDPRLSLRHLAWDACGDLLGIALQAEHDDPEARADAPVLALFDGDMLRPVAAPRSLAGYGGDVASVGNVLAVSCPRAEGIALYGIDGPWQGFIPFPEACALVSAGGELWVGGRHGALACDVMQAALDVVPEARFLPDIRLDNHWIEL
jgi:uncharacterized protein